MNKQIAKQTIKSGIIGAESVVRIPGITTSLEPKLTICYMCKGSGVIRGPIAIGTCGNCMGLGKVFDYVNEPKPGIF
jgi:hypothetical protein